MLKALIYQYRGTYGRFLKKEEKNLFCQKEPKCVSIVARWWKLLLCDRSKALIDSEEDNKNL